MKLWRNRVGLYAALAVLAATSIGGGSAFAVSFLSWCSPTVIPCAPVPTATCPVPAICVPCALPPGMCTTCYYCPLGCLLMGGNCPSLCTPATGGTCL